MNGGSCRWSEPAVDAVVAAIREAIEAVVGSSLMGLYPFGSMTTGDFDPAVSDLDLLAVLTDTPGARLTAHLRRMHAEFARHAALLPPVP
jgi:predicted nucleotidyltransferase